MIVFAGIDGGQSSTVAVIGDLAGRILARGTAGPADEIGVAKASTRLHDALHAALADAKRNAGLPDHVEFGAIVAGVSGYDGRVYGRQPSLPAAHVRLLHDAPIAHAGALGGEAGVIVIAGTGSVVYARDDNGGSSTLGGWGFLFGDEGSAFAIARDALAMLMRAEDDRDRSLASQARVACEFFGVPSLRHMIHSFYKGELTRDRLAKFAPVALRTDAFRPIVSSGADRLAALAAEAIAAGAPAIVALVGGIFADVSQRQRVRAGILRRVSGARIVEPRYEPAYGALLLAYRDAGVAVSELRR